jgi:hypothetical protein
MAVKIITVEGKPDFDCPISWTVEQAKNEIRSGYVLAGGFLREDGVILLGAVLISSTTGALSFTHAQAQRGIFNVLMWHFLLCLFNLAAVSYLKFTFITFLLCPFRFSRLIPVQWNLFYLSAFFLSYGSFSGSGCSFSYGSYPGFGCGSSSCSYSGSGCGSSFSGSGCGSSYGSYSGSG